MNCPHCTKSFAAHVCVTEPGAVPKEGDIGVCYECQGWWQMIDDKLYTYEPTDSDREFVR